MVASKVERLYRQYIKTLSHAKRLRLVELIAHNLVPAESPKRSIMKLRELGKEIWEGIDAQEHVNKLRKEWGRQL